MKTTLIITTYNRKDALELVLLSALEQTLMPEEIIVADDGSRPDTKKLIDTYRPGFGVPLHHCWHEDEGFQLAKIRNRAIAMAKGDYIIMIDGDMIMHPGFVKSHLHIAREGFFIQGSRVLLSEELTKTALEKKQINFSLFESKMKNHLNAIDAPLLSPLFSKKKPSIAGVRGCNMAFWREDCIRINGFNEAFVGWGREDSEFVTRVLNSGLQRRNLKFGGVAYHLYHPENTRATLPQNDLILQQAIDHKVTYCEKGIAQYL